MLSVCADVVSGRAFFAKIPYSDYAIDIMLKRRLKFCPASFGFIGVHTESKHKIFTCWICSLVEQLDET